MEFPQEAIQNLIQSGFPSGRTEPNAGYFPCALPTSSSWRKSLRQACNSVSDESDLMQVKINAPGYLSILMLQVAVEKMGVKSMP